MDVVRVLRAAASAGLAGAIAGILVGGLGGRIAMRISGALSDATVIGTRTANGNTVGEITLGGTLALAFFSGLLPGVIAGAAYAAARPWSAPLGRWAGPAFGLVLLAAVGPVVLEPFNVDFRRFGPAALNVLLFAALFPIFGAVVAWTLDLVEPRVMSARSASPWSAAGAFGLLALGFTLVIAFGALVSFSAGSVSVGDPRGFLLLYFLAVPVVARLVLGRGGALRDARSLPAPVRVVTYALLLAPALAGLPGTVEAAAFLARP